jgi:coenzyme F420-dependent glucose-6-phosphate dehydrogenase
MNDIRYFYGAAHEQFEPGDLLQQAVAAEEAGFDGIECSDHFQPWWEPGESGHAWVWLGAVGQATKRIPIGTGVTAPVYRHNPAVTAQAFMTLEAMFPGRAFLGIGSGESLNESPCGMDWPPVAEQIERMEEALEIINALFSGAHLDHEGKYFRTKRAYLHTRAEQRPPIYVSAFGPKAAGVAGRQGDGLWTLADPENVPEIVDAYKSAAEDVGREPGPVLLQTAFSWAQDDDAALEACRVWKGAQPDEFYTEDWHDPAEMYRRGEEQMSDDEFKQAFIISSSPEEHAERVREVEKLGADIVVLMNVSGADPEGAIRVYQKQVLPSLRRARVG